MNSHETRMRQPVILINRLGHPSYYCGMCGKVLFHSVGIGDINSTIPEKCPHCGESVSRPRSITFMSEKAKSQTSRKISHKWGERSKPCGSENGRETS